MGSGASHHRCALMFAAIPTHHGGFGQAQGGGHEVGSSSRSSKDAEYRLIVAIAYKMQYVYVKFIGPHADYDKVDATTVDQFSGE